MLNSYGMPGLVEMPVAEALPDAELVGTVAYFDSTTRSTLAFQALPRVTAAFRYSGLEGLGGAQRDTLYDRSFDLHVLLAREGAWRPAIALGFRDFIGTGVYSGEYLAATKRFGAVALTGGVGWGRLGRGGYEARAGPSRSTDQGGQLEAARWFSGDPALFAGLSWDVSDRLRVAVEHSSDSYRQEGAAGVVTRDTQLNFGFDWQLSNASRVKLFYLYGREVGVALHVGGNPAKSRAPSGHHAGPIPVRRRGARVDTAGWQADLIAALTAQGLDVVSLGQSGAHLRIDLRNLRYSAAAEAIGRTARVLSALLPDEIEMFHIVPVENGLRTATVSLRRSDVERFVHAADGSEALWRAAVIAEAPPARMELAQPGRFPQLSWGVGPYLRASFFDPSRPVMADFGLRASAALMLSPRLRVSGSLRKSLANNFGDSDRVSDSVLPRVRSDAGRYLREGDPALETLSLVYLFRPGPQLYGRLSFGYLETQYGGLSTEILWKPVQRPYGLGVEINAVRQRAFDQGFGFRSYEVVTGHVSGYFAFASGIEAQVDLGRYLAGDWGATVSLDRTFANGWRVGAYATFTDVSFEDFGEGSFDKGLRFTIPLEPFLGRPTRRKFGVTVQPLTRDGGARLHVDGRLYAQVRAFHARGLKSSWGRVWR